MTNARIKALIERIESDAKALWDMVEPTAEEIAAVEHNSEQIGGSDFVAHSNLDDAVALIHTACSVMNNMREP